VKTKKTGTRPKGVKRCGVFDRAKAKRDCKAAMDTLWRTARTAASDLSVTKYEVSGFEATLQAVENELNTLMTPLGAKAALPDEMFV
jgi:hypothetical protein